MAITQVGPAYAQQIAVIGEGGYRENIDKSLFDAVFYEYARARDTFPGLVEGNIRDDCLSKKSIVVLKTIVQGKELPGGISLLPFIEIEAFRKKLCAPLECFRQCEESLYRSCCITFGWNPGLHRSRNKGAICEQEWISLYSCEKWFVQGLAYLAREEQERVSWQWERIIVRGRKEDWAREFMHYRPSDRETRMAESLARGNVLTMCGRMLAGVRVGGTRDPAIQTFYLDFSIFRELLWKRDLAGVAFRAISRVCLCTLIVHESDLIPFLKFSRRHKKEITKRCECVEYRFKEGDYIEFSKGEIDSSEMLEILESLIDKG